MQASSSRAVGEKDSESYHSDTDSLSARVTNFAQSHILFLLLFF